MMLSPLELVMVLHLSSVRLLCVCVCVCVCVRVCACVPNCSFMVLGWRHLQYICVMELLIVDDICSS